VTKKTKLLCKPVSEQWRHQALVNAWSSWIDARRQTVVYYDCCSCTKKSADNSEPDCLSGRRSHTVFSRRQSSAVLSVDGLGQWTCHTRSCTCHQWRYDEQKLLVPVYCDQQLQQHIVRFKFHCQRYQQFVI